VDQFEKKEGKYAIKGYPHKLGLLLSGIPGTGKRSLIKALLNYTKRHIVNMPLNRITTNAQFMKVMFNRKYTDLQGNPHDLDFKDIIFVLEDVDACTDVVFRRTFDASGMHKQSGGGGDPVKREEIPQKLAEERTETQAKKVVRSLIRDQLSLSGIFNVLDGVVETPGRIVVITSNHPDMLDPALIRPGRIDRHLHLGHMELDDICAMLGHYFPNSTMTDDGKRRLSTLLEKQGITPAEVEQLVAEENTVESFIDKVGARLAQQAEATE